MIQKKFRQIDTCTTTYDPRLFLKSKVTSEKSILLYHLSYVPMFLLLFVETAGLEPATWSLKAK